MCFLEKRLNDWLHRYFENSKFRQKKSVPDIKNYCDIYRIYIEKLYNIHRGLSVYYGYHLPPFCLLIACTHTESQKFWKLHTYTPFL